MSAKCRYAVSLVSLCLAAACGGKKANDVAPVDPFMSVDVGKLDLTALSGSTVLLLTAGGVVAGDSANPIPELESRRNALVAVANAALDSALRRDGRAVTWMGMEEQRSVARRNPTLGLDPDRLSTVELFPPKIERVPDPLFGRLRQFAAMTGARYAVAAPAVKLSGTMESLTAHYIIVLVDARTGQMRYRARASGRPAPTPEAALASAAAMVVSTPLNN